MKLNELNIKEARKGLAAKEFSSVELTKACLARIKTVEPKINAFVSVCEEEAVNAAERADKLLSQDSTQPLLGVPISVKDNFCTNGIRTTASSRVLENFIPPYDATVVARLKEAGAIIIGKTNLDAWAHGSSTETSDFGATKNPWSTDHLPGGSSGGSAASVAADEAIASIGSETAGSIRQPASWCGVVGLKPTYGRVSRYGVVAMASSLDSPGPITKTVEDSATILNILAGSDGMDATMSPQGVEDYSANLESKISGLKVGVSKSYYSLAEPEVIDAFERAKSTLAALGTEIVEHELFDPKHAIAVYTILQRAEVSSNLARYDGIRYGNDRSYFGDEAKRRIMLGTYALSAGYYDQYYNKAQKVRTLIINDFDKAFGNVDILIAPTSPSTALKVGASAGQAMFGEKADMLVEPSSIAGLPGINVCCGFSKEGLPIGFQIIGPQFSESLILNVAHQFERTLSFHSEKPKL